MVFTNVDKKGGVHCPSCQAIDRTIYSLRYERHAGGGFQRPRQANERRDQSGSQVEIILAGRGIRCSIRGQYRSVRSKVSNNSLTIFLFTNKKMRSCFTISTSNSGNSSLVISILTRMESQILDPQMNWAKYIFNTFATQRTTA
jgi:hypothetical protein